MKALIFTLTISLFALPLLAGEGKVCNEEFLNSLDSLEEEMRELITLENIKKNLSEGHDVDCVNERGLGLLHLLAFPYSHYPDIYDSKKVAKEKEEANKLILEEKKKIITYLVEEKGADIELYSSRFSEATPLALVARFLIPQEYEIFFLFIALGADINYKYPDGQSVLDELRDKSYGLLFSSDPFIEVVPLSKE